MIRRFSWIGPSILVVGIISLFIPWDWFEGKKIGRYIIDLDVYSGFGEFVGGVMSVVAVGLIYMTYRAQKLELDETRSVMRKQAFEMTFYNMLSELNGIIELMVGTIVNKKYSRRNYMFRVFMQYKDRCNDGMKSINRQDQAGELLYGNVIHQEYENTIYHDHQQNLSHYFRYVYSIIKFVRTNSEENPEIIADKYYVDQLQARISNSEMGLLFYNAISIHGRTSKGEYRFKEWLDHYGFFENIDPNFLVLEEHAKQFYPKTNFKFLIKS